MGNKSEIKLRCVAIDDEPFALKLLADDASKIPFLDIVATFTSPLSALEYLRSNRVDLLLLDIQMPILKGNEFLRSLPNPPMVIFTTAFQQYALEGFELNVVDYLLKPIPFDRFLKAVNKAYDLFLLRQNKQAAADTASFFIHSEYKEIKIFCHDILYIEGLKDYVKIFLVSQSRPVLTRLNLKGIEAKLPSNQFCRVHNSFIVSLSKISSTQKQQIFIEEIAIPIGDRYAEDFRQKYGSIHKD